MKHSLFSLLAILFLPWSLSGQELRLSPQAQFSLLTASPGTELYSVFGHSALRVYDPGNGIDEVYNYGTFDFNTPNFYLKFIRGKLMYQLSVSSLSSFLPEYAHEKRAVYEQILILNHTEKEQIYEFLLVNSLPENRSYLYDFFYDNCSTRIRDIIDNQLDIDWGEDPFTGPPRSFRDMLQPYVAPLPWAAFGIDLALGLPADRVAAPWHYMFLPDEMFVAVAQARHADGRPLVEGYQLLLADTPAAARQFRLTPVFIMWAIFVIGCLSLFNKRFSMIFDKVYFTLLGLVGVVVLSLWFFSDHASTNQNMNLLWALPTHLYFIFRVKELPGNRAVKRYFQITCIISFLLLVLWPLIPQGYNPAFFPLIALVTVKAWWNSR